MKYVYILESLDSLQFYVGITDDLRARLAKTYVAFSDEEQPLHSRNI